MRGQLIVFEGADGSGTTSVSKAVCKALAEEGHTVRWQCEPTYSPIGALIRNMLRGEAAPTCDTAMMHLFMADRLDHLDKVIIPETDRGITVICDRFDVSTLVYQSVSALGIGVAKARMEAMYSAMRQDGLYVPDLVFLLDTDVEIMAERREHRGESEEIYETNEFQKKVVDLYRWWYSEDFYRGKKVRIDASQSLGDVIHACLRLLDFGYG